MFIHTPYRLVNPYTSTQTSSRVQLFEKILALPFYLRVIGFLASIALAISTFFIVMHMIDVRFFVSVPEQGGVLTEGEVGRPRLINPIFAKTEVDRDLSALIYSGLLRPQGNELAPDLAESYTVSEDGKTYTFTIRKDATFHDGKPVTADDVIFTVDHIKNKGLPTKSPLAPNFVGVTATATDARTVVFSLEQPYASFTESLTFGILPKHIWETVGTDDFDQTNFNLEPIGSGPYEWKSVERDSQRGLARKYVLTAFPGYVHGKPLISEFDIFFYGSEDERISAYKNGEIKQIAGVQTSYARDIASSGAPVLSAPMPRIFGIYLNEPKRTIFNDAVVREALDITIPRTAITTKVFYGYANPEIGPFPGLARPDGLPDDKHLLLAEAMLEKDGWVKDATGIYAKTDKKTKQTDTLSFALSLPDIPELTASAQLITAAWKTLGVNVELKTYDLGTFTSDILASRNFDAVFFGQVTGRDPDPYPFWHSSQKTRGTNIAQYADKKVDARINDLSKTVDPVERANILSDINSLIMNDRPALFTYSPNFVYVTDQNVHGIKLPLMTTAAERFSGIEQWYTSSERVWKFLAKGKTIE
jgi:peptide/nickel transport system substrate-binding protein